MNMKTKIIQSTSIFSYFTNHELMTKYINSSVVLFQGIQ